MIENQLKVIDKYISIFHPHIHEITSLDNVLVISAHRYYFFCYGKQAIIAIKPRTKQIFVSGGTKVVPDDYYVKGILTFSSTISGLLSLTNDEFNDVIMEWIRNKHPQIDSYHKLYDFCKSNAKKLSKVQHLLE
jgi:hypothetical protein